MPMYNSYFIQRSIAIWFYIYLYIFDLYGGFYKNSVRLRTESWIEPWNITMLYVHTHVLVHIHTLKHTQQVRFLKLRECKHWSGKLYNPRGSIKATRRRFYFGSWFQRDKGTSYQGSGLNKQQALKLEQGAERSLPSW